MFEDAAPGSNLYAVVGPMAEDFVPPVGLMHVRDMGDFRGLLAKEPEWDGLVVHGLPFDVAKPMLDDLPATLAVAWYVWGFEAYTAWPRLGRHLLMPETRRLVRRARPAWKRWAPRRSALADPFGREARKVVGRYDYCVCQFREEFDLFVETGLVSTTRYQRGSVGSFEDVVDTGDSSDVGDDIQLGNSASATNNHADALAFLSRPEFRAHRVVVPLGYGDGRYRLEVASAGQTLLGDRFVPMMGFLPLAQYLSIMASCGHVVMNHLRPQALGNIYAALWRGASVYMNETAIFRGLRNSGFTVRSIERDLLSDSNRRMRPESQSRVTSNRSLLFERLGREVVAAQAADLLDRLSSCRREGTSGGLARR